MREKNTLLYMAALGVGYLAYILAISILAKEYNGVFISGFIFVTIAVILQVGLKLVLSKEEKTIKSYFWNLPINYISGVYIVVDMAVTALLLIMAGSPSSALVIQIIIFAVFMVMILTGFAQKNILIENDRKRRKVLDYQKNNEMRIINLIEYTEKNIANKTIHNFSDNTVKNIANNKAENAVVSIDNDTSENITDKTSPNIDNNISNNNTSNITTDSAVDNNTGNIADKIRKNLSKAAEIARFSVPMKHEKLVNIEEKIELQISSLEINIQRQDPESNLKEIENLIILLNQRNNIAKTIKM